MQKKHIYTSDYLASERMKFICAVNIYASGTVTALQQLSINTKKNFIPQLRVKKNKQKDQIVEKQFKRVNLRVVNNYMYM